MLVKYLVIATTLAAACAAASCGGDSTGDSQSSTDPACFLALPTDFATWKTWPSNHYDATSDIGANVHVSGPRTEYYNRTPDKGASAFSVGTIIVKEIEATDPANHHIFAMAKRGCDFNVDGAKDWEWFELDNSTGTSKILWRGVVPPVGDNYNNGDPTGGCNSCHGASCKQNDSVCSPSAVLQLSP